MKYEVIYTCHLRKIENAKVGDWQKYQVERHFTDGEGDVLSEGCYYACRSSIDRYYHHVNKQQRRYQAFWSDENTFEVYDANSIPFHSNEAA